MVLLLVTLCTTHVLDLCLPSISMGQVTAPTIVVVEPSKEVASH